MTGTGSSNVEGLESFLYADNMSFDGTERNGIDTDGQLWIGNAALPHVRKGTITSSTLTIDYSAPDITIETNGGGAPIETVTGNTGGPIAPVAGNIDVVTANSTPVFVGTAGTQTLDFGLNNLLLGTSAPSLTSGDFNVGLGLQSLNAVSTGSSNTAVGFRSQLLNSTGIGNTSFGHISLVDNVSSSSNTAIGFNALGTLISGAGANTAVGINAGVNLATGIQNTILGSSAGSSYTGAESSNVLIKNDGVFAESNTIRIGTSGVGAGQQDRAFVAGITGVTVAASAPVAVDTNGQLSDLGFGTATQVLTSNGAGVSPTWQATAAGTDLHVARFIVHPTAASANFTTITAAIAAASAGDTIHIQSKATAYNEDFELPAGINLVAYSADATTPNVTIKGKITCLDTGIRSISGIRLETDADFALSITGTNAVQVIMTECYINITNNTAIFINNSNALLRLYRCKSNTQTTGIALYSVTTCNKLEMHYTDSDNTGLSTTQNTFASGELTYWWSREKIPISITGDAKLTFRFSRFETRQINVVALTLNTSATDNQMWSFVVSSGTATAIVITAGTLSLTSGFLRSFNSVAISGAGTLNYSGISFSDSHVVTVSNQITGGFRQGKPPFEEITGTSHNAIIGGHYIANNAGLVTINLPSVFEVGDIVHVVGKGTGLWVIDAPAGDVIHFGNQTTSSGGTITATHRYDAIKIVGTVANSEWTCDGTAQGNMTVA